MILMMQLRLKDTLMTSQLTTFLYRRAEHGTTSTYRNQLLPDIAPCQRPLSVVIQKYRRSLHSRTRVDWSDQTPAFVRGRNSELEETYSPPLNPAHRGLPLLRRLSTGGRHFQQPSRLFHYLPFLLVLLPLRQHRSLRLSRSPNRFSSQSSPPFRPPPINFRMRTRRRFTSGSLTSSAT